MIGIIRNNARRASVKNWIANCLMIISP